MDEGICEQDGASRAKTDIENNTWEEYQLFYNGVRLYCGQKFSDYGIPNKGATIDVVKVVSDPQYRDQIASR